MAGPYDNRGEKVNEVNTYDVFGSHNPEAAVRNRALPPVPATTFECLVLILDQV
jgi:hypothetical protein